MNVFASAETRHERASHGRGVVSPPLNVSSVSYMPFTAICEVGSNIRAGSIVCFSSPLGLVATPASGAYSASKAGILALVRSLAVDHARDGIRVNAVLPGPTETKLMWANVPDDEVDTMRDVIRGEVPLGRLAEPEEVARVAVWLLSDDASYITGAQIACDGGILARAAVSV